MEPNRQLIKWPKSSPHLIKPHPTNRKKQKNNREVNISQRLIIHNYYCNSVLGKKNEARLSKYDSGRDVKDEFWPMKNGGMFSKTA